MDSRDDCDLSDVGLMRRVQAGQPHRFAIIVQRYQAALLRVARSHLGRDDLAEEAVQETFLAAFKSRHTFDPCYNFRTWLWTILINQCRGQHRRHARRLPQAVARETSSAGAACIPPDDLLADDPPPLERLLAKERTAQLERLLGRLSRVQADALRLRFFGGLKFQEIADTLECSLSTAKNRVRWGLLHLAEMIDPRTAREAAGNVPLEDTTP